MSKEEVKPITEDDNLEELKSATPSEDIMEDQALSEEDNKVEEVNEDNKEIEVGEGGNESPEALCSSEILCAMALTRLSILNSGIKISMML